MTMNVDRMEVEQLVVDRHVKMRSELGGIDIHSSSTALGVWLAPAGSRNGVGTVGLFIQNGVANLTVYPNYSKNRPFSISANGLQVVKRDGTVRIMPLERLADLVDKLMTEEKT